MVNWNAYRKALTAAVLAVLLTQIPAPSEAGEGAFSNYFPGAYGSLLPGMAPEPGNVFASVNLLYNGKASRAVNGGKIDASMESKAFYALFQGLHVWDAPELGGRFAIGGYLPLGYASYSASVGGLSTSQDEFALGDIGIIPASYYRSSGYRRILHTYPRALLLGSCFLHPSLPHLRLNTRPDGCVAASD